MTKPKLVHIAPLAVLALSCIGIYQYYDIFSNQLLSESNLRRRLESETDEFHHDLNSESNDAYPDPNDAYPDPNDAYQEPNDPNPEFNDPQLEQQPPPPPRKDYLFGTRILITVPSYGLDQFHYLEDMIDGFRDMCEAGALVQLIIYASFPYQTETINLLNSRTQCRNRIGGSLDIVVKVKSPAWKLHFVDFHRKEFYDNLENFDLFIYSEDDMDIRPRHVAAYLAETERLQGIAGKHFFDYSLGFVRYEMHQGKRISWEQRGYQLVHKLDGKYIHPQNVHQAMFMATSEQLTDWKHRCSFHRVDPPDSKLPNYYREYVSSLRLFKKSKGNVPGCGVQKVLPLDTFEDFRIHHMSDKYVGDYEENQPEFRYHLKDSFDLQRLRTHMRLIEDFSAKEKWVDEDGNYNGVRMEFNEKAHGIMDEEEREEYLAKALEVYGEYDSYAKMGGKLRPAD